MGQSTLVHDTPESPNQQQWPFSCDGLWAGKLPLSVPPRVDFVVAHCSTSLRNVTKLIAEVKASGFTVGSVDIYSKCGQAPDVQPEAAIAHHLPNVGGNDHTYAYHMASVSSRTNLASDGVIVFIKDTWSTTDHQSLQQQGNLTEAIMMAAGPAGFGCFNVPVPGISAFANSSALGDFAFSGDAHYLRVAHHYAPRADGVPFKSPHRNLKRWLIDAVRADLPTPATPVCYGGNFGAQMRNVVKNAHVWPALTQSLERAVQLEEGHFAERSWAALLMDVSKIGLQSVMCASQKGILDGGYQGIMGECNFTKCTGSGPFFLCSYEMENTL